MIAAAKQSHVEAMVELYMKYMFDSSFVHLGKRFLTLLFQGLVASSCGRSYVYEDKGKVVGFICATTHGGKLFRQVIAGRIWALFCTVLSVAVRRPALTRVIIESFRYRQKVALPLIEAELLFIALDPSFRGRGVSKELIDCTLRNLRASGVKQVKVTTLKNNHVVVRLLDELGFKQTGSFTLYGKKNLAYTLQIADYERRFKADQFACI